MSNAPSRIRINHDDYAARFIGKTADRRQFFLTSPFVPCEREFLALYIWNENGRFLEATIEDMGRREELNLDTHRNRKAQLLEGFGEVRFCDICVAPFQIERFGVVFGLVANAPEEHCKTWWVSAEPGDYMAFYPPWNGDYDT